MCLKVYLERISISSDCRVKFYFLCKTLFQITSVLARTSFGVTIHQFVYRLTEYVTHISTVRMATMNNSVTSYVLQSVIVMRSLLLV